VDLASASQELYAGSPDDFVERRKQLVAQARAAKDRQLATAIGKLRRPTRSAWLVNLYAREAADELGTLLDLGAALQAAQQELSGPDLRRLSADRGKALDAATRRAVEIGREHDYDAPEAARTEVTQTLQAALAEPDVAAQVRAGTLSQAQSYGGFGFALAPASAPAPADGSPTPAPGGAAPDAGAEAGAEPDDEEAAQRRRDAQQAEEQRRAREDAERKVADAETELAAATEEATVATERADELAEQVERLRSELAAAEEAETAARQEARTARRRVSELEGSVQDARDALDAL
jgi:polyhydroxyalkanoate synthesis regulator phasin